MLDDNIQDKVKQIVGAIKDTEICKTYYFQLGKIKKTPELYEKVNEYRRRNYELQNTSQDGDLLEKMDAFEAEYEEFCENPIVGDFLRAELAFCRLVQEVYTYITEELDVDFG